MTQSAHNPDSAGPDGFPPGSWRVQVREALSPGWPGRPAPASARDCAKAHPWDSPGEIIITIHYDAGTGERWVTVEHADPVVRISHNLLAGLLPSADGHWMTSWARLSHLAHPFSLCADGQRAAIDPYLPVWRDSQGRMHPHGDGLLGARLRVEAANQIVVYQLLFRLDEYTWVGVWPEHRFAAPTGGAKQRHAAWEAATSQRGRRR